MVGDVETTRAISALTGKTFSIEDAREKIPKKGGLYAWWLMGAALPGVPANKHPVEPGIDLLYIGIAPSGEASTATLRSRVVGNHLNGNIAASTLRRTLASLLIQSLSLAPITKGKKVVLPKDQNSQLSVWQKTNLRLTWHETSKPWLLEAGVIEALRPPLNLADNEAHPFYRTLSDARRALKQAAR